MKKVKDFFKVKRNIVITSILLFILVVVSLFFILNAKSNEELEKSYLVLFESNGGSSVMSQRVIEGNNVKRPENPTKNGFTFLDWFLDDKEFDFDSYKVTKDITLKAKWNIIEGTEVVVVHFNSDGGTEIDDIELVKGDILNPPVNPTRDGYRFSGWSYNGEQYNFDSPINENATFIAIWVKDNNSNSNNNSHTNIDNVPVKVGKCEYGLNGYGTDNYSTSLSDDEFGVIRMSYDVMFNPRWYYSGGCEIRYKSSNDEVASIDSEGYIWFNGLGTVKLYSCIYEKSTSKELKCFMGTLTNTYCHPADYYDPTIPYSDLSGVWYAKNSNNATVELADYRYYDFTDEHEISYRFKGIDKNTLYYSCISGTCTNELVNGYSERTSLGYFEREYSVKLKNGKLYLSKNGRTVEFSKTPANIPVYSLDLDKDSEKVKVGERFVISSYVSPNNASMQGVDWTNSNPSVATIKNYGYDENTENGRLSRIQVTGVSNGTTILSATTKDGKISKSITVTVYGGREPVRVSGVTLNKTNLEIERKGTYQLIASVNPSNSDNIGVSWSSSNPSVVSVSSSGVVTALGAGSAVITVTTNDGGYQASCNVNVITAPLTATASIGISSRVTSNGAYRGIFAEVNASGGSKTYTYYYIKLYKDGVKIAETTNTSSREIFVTGFGNGVYSADFEVRDSDGTVYNGNSGQVSISGF